MASRTWQPADALTLSGSATIVSQQQLRLQHRTAAAYTTNYSALSHSFRDPGQSFRVPPAATSSSSPAAASQQQQQQQQQFSKQSYIQQQHHQQPSPTALEGGGQSFLPSPAELALPGAPRPSSSSGRGSRPPTAGGPTTSATTDLPSSSSFARTTLPPLSSVFPQSLAAPGGPTVLPALQSGGGVRRPTTAPRLGIAPAAYLSSRLSFGGGLGGGSRLAPITEFSVPHSGRGGFAHYPEQLGGGAYAAYDAS